MSCTAVTRTGTPCRSKGKYTFGNYRSCGIGAHITQVQKMANLTVPGRPSSPAPPERPLDPGVSPLVPAVVYVENGTVTRQLLPPARRAGDKSKYIYGARGKYRVIQKLGHGAYGTVYDVELEGKRYAIKQQQSTDAGSAMSMSALVEADIMSRLCHPHLVEMHEVFFEGGKSTSINYVMEREEITLRALTTPQPAEVVKRLAFQLATVVQFLHQQLVIHADIKPENILLSRREGEYYLKLTDFGLSQYNMNQAKSLEVQTYWYRAPEIWERNKHYDTAIDMWSVGLILRELLTCYPLSSSRAEKSYYQTIRTLLGETPDVTAGLANARTKASWDPEEWQEYLRLINACLTYEPSKRLTASELLTSSLFKDYVVPQGSYYFEETSPPILKEGVGYQLLQEWVAPFPAYQKSTLVLATDLFDRARVAGEVPVAEEREIALGALNIALKINQRTPLPSNSYPQLIGRATFTTGEMWNLEARVAQLVGFRLYLDNVVGQCPTNNPEVIWQVYWNAHQQEANTRDFQVLCPLIREQAAEVAR
jgi:negative regulator of PHO system